MLGFIIGKAVVYRFDIKKNQDKQLRDKNALNKKEETEIQYNKFFFMKVKVQKAGLNRSVSGYISPNILRLTSNDKIYKNTNIFQENFVHYLFKKIGGI